MGDGLTVTGQGRSIGDDFSTVTLRALMKSSVAEITRPARRSGAKTKPAVVTGSGKRERNKQANRAAILEAARKCFLKMGYDAVTIRDVVRRTRLAAGTFYNYFTDKDVLFKAVLEARITEVSEALHDVRMRAESVEDFVYSAYRALFDLIQEDPSFFQLILRNEHAVRTLFEDTVIGIPMRQLRTDLEEFVRRGVFPPLDVDMLAAAFYGVGFEMGRQLATSKSPDSEGAARFAAQLMTSGISAFGISRAATGRAHRKDVMVRGSLP